MALSKQSILKHAGVFKTREVHVPAWEENGDDVVLVRGMTVREFEINQASIGKDDGKATAALIARCAMDSSGARLFDDKDVDQLAEMALKEINELAKVIVEESGLAGDDDVKPKPADAVSDESAEGEGESGKSPTSSGLSGSELRAI